MPELTRSLLQEKDERGVEVAVEGAEDAGKTRDRRREWWCSVVTIGRCVAFALLLGLPVCAVNLFSVFYSFRPVFSPLFLHTFGLTAVDVLYGLGHTQWLLYVVNWTALNVLSMCLMPAITFACRCKPPLRCYRIGMTANVVVVLVVDVCYYVWGLPYAFFIAIYTGFGALSSFFAGRCVFPASLKQTLLLMILFCSNAVLFELFSFSVLQPGYASLTNSQHLLVRLLVWPPMEITLLLFFRRITVALVTHLSEEQCRVASLPISFLSHVIVPLIARVLLSTMGDLFTLFLAAFGNMIFRLGFRFGFPYAVTLWRRLWHRRSNKDSKECVGSCWNDSAWMEQQALLLFALDLAEHVWIVATFVGFVTFYAVFKTTNDVWLVIAATTIQWVAEIITQLVSYSWFPLSSVAHTHASKRALFFAALLYLWPTLLLPYVIMFYSANTCDVTYQHTGHWCSPLAYNFTSASDVACCS